MDLPEDTGDRLPLTHMLPDYFPTTVLPPLTDNNNAFVELSFMQPMTNLIQLEQPHALDPGEMVLLQMTENSARQVVVKRDDDLLTPSQIKENYTDVRKAMLKFANLGKAQVLQPSPTSRSS